MIKKLFYYIANFLGVVDIQITPGSKANLKRKLKRMSKNDLIRWVIEHINVAK